MPTNATEYALRKQLEAAKQRELELLAVIEKMRSAIVLALNKVTCDPKLQIVATLEDALNIEPSKALREHEAKIVAEYKKDAERYRWVRDECTSDKAPQHTWIVESPGDLWDAAIDDAMAEERRKN